MFLLVSRCTIVIISSQPGTTRRNNNSFIFVYEYNKHIIIITAEHYVRGKLNYFNIIILYIRSAFAKIKMTI